MIRFLTLGLCLASTAAVAQDKLLEFRGICDASGAVALDDNRIVVGDDEKPFLSIYRLDNQSRETPISLPSAVGGSNAESDIEAATIFQGRILWITSHGRSKKGKVQADRFQLFASHRRSANVDLWEPVFSVPSRTLITAIRQSTDPAYRKLQDAIGDLGEQIEELAPKKKGFNIEAMTADKDGKLLLIGMRNPQANNDALVFEIVNAHDLLEGSTTQPKLGRVMPVDLKGRGMRDMAWSPAHGTYLIAAGQVDDEAAGPGFAVFSWSGSGRDTTRLEAFDGIFSSHRDFHPEAIVPLLERNGGTLVPSKRVLLISDDGTKKVSSGKDCKDAGDDQKSFRGAIRLID